MPVRRLVAVGLILLAVIVLSYDLITSGASAFTSLGDLWGKLSAPSLNLMQAIVQRYIHPAVWDPVLVTVLLLPVWLTLAVLSLFLSLRLSRTHEIGT